MSRTEAKSNKKNKSLLNNPFFWAAVAGMIILPVIRMLAMARRDAPPPLVQISPWTLFNETGQKFSSEALKGKLVLFHLYYPGCISACEKSFEVVQEVKKRFSHVSESLRIISFSVAGGADTQTPETFYRKNPAARNDWFFLQGNPSQIKEVLIENFKLVDLLTNNQGRSAISFGHDPKEKPNTALMRVADVGELYFLDQNGHLRLAVETDSASLAGLVRAGLFLLEKGPDS